MKFYNCLICENYIGKKAGIKKPICKAFLDGIPNEILSGGNDHKEPFKGDNGIRFEPIKNSKT